MQAEQVTVNVLRSARKALKRQQKALNFNEGLRLIRTGRAWGKQGAARGLRPALSLARLGVYITDEIPAECTENSE